MRLASAGDAPAVEIAIASGPVRRIAGRMKLHSGGTSTTLTSIARFSASWKTPMLTSESFVAAMTMNEPSRSSGRYARRTHSIEPSAASSSIAGSTSGAIDDDVAVAGQQALDLLEPDLAAADDEAAAAAELAGRRCRTGVSSIPCTQVWSQIPRRNWHTQSFPA